MYAENTWNDLGQNDLNPSSINGLYSVLRNTTMNEKAVHDNPLFSSEKKKKLK